MTRDTHGRGRRSELMMRVASSLALASVALVSAWFGGIVFALVWGVAALSVWREWLFVIGVQGDVRSARFLVGALGVTGSIVAVMTLKDSMILAFLPAVLSGLVLVALFRRKDMGWAWQLFGPLYSSTVIVGPLALRGRATDGLMILVWLFLVVWISDIGAFFAGRTVGGPKLWPSVSPKKTWSGSLGGLIAGTVVPVGFVLAVKAIFGVVWLSGAGLIGLTLSTAIIAEFGDLFESAMKRHFGVKDSGTLIPGHGGIMDRLDSYAAAAFYVFFVSEIFGI